MITLDSYGQLGLGHFNDTARVTRIDALFEISKIAAGIQHSLFLNREGVVYMAGANEDGQ